ncbi:MAG TPA: YicC family protein [Syntrophomonas sp.]|nr:YicC family protein [Syntrophomonas sp.]
MVRSMTGFGRSQIRGQGYVVSCEMRGVNHRFLDVHIRTSRRYSILEEKVKEEIKNQLTRGRIEISLTIEKTDDSRRAIKVDKGLALAYYNYLKELAENLNISPEISVIDVFRLPEVFSLEDEEENLEMVWQVVKEAIGQALTSLIEMRTREGINLTRDILARNEGILRAVENLEARSPLVVQEYQTKLKSRITEMLANEAVDEQRILQEAALFADRINVTEELVRLKSHVMHLEELMNSNESVGRKCDFLVQEMFREINTVSSKANDLEMNRVVVEVKAELEKIREQMQNIE